MPIRPAADGFSATAAIALPSSDRFKKNNTAAIVASDATRMKTSCGRDAELNQSPIVTRRVIAKDRRHRLLLAAPDHLGEVAQDDRDADGAQDPAQRERSPQRPHRHPLDDAPITATAPAESRQADQQRDDRPARRPAASTPKTVKRQHAADHQEVALGEVQRLGRRERDVVALRDQRVDAAVDAARWRSACGSPRRSVSSASMLRALVTGL